MVYMSLFQYHTFDYDSSVVSFEIRKCEISTLFLFQDGFGTFFITHVNKWMDTLEAKACDDRKYGDLIELGKSASEK